VVNERRQAPIARIDAESTKISLLRVPHEGPYHNRQLGVNGMFHVLREKRDFVRRNYAVFPKSLAIEVEIW
jgi:hypothetical protein